MKVCSAFLYLVANLSETEKVAYSSKDIIHGDIL